MTSAVLRSAACTLILGHSLLIAPSLWSDSMEFGVKADGARRVDTTLLYTGSGISAGCVYRYEANAPNGCMAGFNAPWAAVGQLGDAGLAAELRNPGYESLGRVDERTMYRANLRSLSRTRMGLALAVPSGRWGAVAEKRERQDVAAAWIVPVSRPLFRLEVMGSGGRFFGSPPDAAWYPKEWGTPPGIQWQAGSRVILSPGAWRWGVTAAASAGESVRPAMMGAFSWSWADGGWRVRSRSVFAERHYRSTEGEPLDRPIGTGFDVRFRPSAGFQWAIDYAAGMESAYPAGHFPRDGGAVAMGWDFGSLLVMASGTWGRLLFGEGPSPEEPALSRIKAEIRWNRGQADAGLIGIIEPDGPWSVILSGGFPASGPLLVEPRCAFHQESGPLLADIQLKVRWNVGTGRILLRIEMADLPRDWKKGPTGAGDGEVEIRYIHRIHD